MGIDTIYQSTVSKLSGVAWAMAKAGIFAVVLIVAFARPSAATRSCEIFWQATAVFIGHVDSVSAIGRQSGPDVHFTVLESFRGVDGRSVSATIVGGSCRSRLRSGSDYLVYAYRDEATGRLTVSPCSTTRILETAGVEVAYARAAAVKDLMSVTGVIRVDQGARSVAHPSTAGLVVVLEREGVEIRPVTDRQGRFAAEGVAAGRYAVRLDLPETLAGQVWPNPLVVSGTRGCLELHGTVAFNGRVRGRVVDAAGVPVAGVTLDLVAPTRRTSGLDPALMQTVTGSDGSYEIRRVPPGEYVVGVNTGPDAVSAGLSPVFHPGVVRLENAHRLKLSGGEMRMLGDLTLPSAVRLVRLSGVVVDPDGAPAADARVFLKGAGHIEYVLASPVTTDNRGQFAVAAFGGIAYRLFAERTRTDGSSRIDSSEELHIAASVGASPVRLALRRRY